MIPKLLLSKTFNEFFKIICDSNDPKVLLLEEVLGHYFTLLQKDLEGLFQDIKKIDNILKIFGELYKQNSVIDSWYQINSLRIKFFISIINNFKNIKLHNATISESEINDLLDSIFIIIQVQKIQIIDNIDPYSISLHECTLDINSLPSITIMDMVNYLILTHSFYTGEQLKAYKSLQAYKYFEAGYAQEILAKQINDDAFVVIGKMYQTNALRISSQNNEVYNILAHIYSSTWDLILKFDLKIGSRISTNLDRLFRRLPESVIPFLQKKLQNFKNLLTYWILSCGDIQAQCGILNIVLTLCPEKQKRNHLLQILTKDATIVENLNDNNKSLRCIMDHINLMQGENRSVYTAHAFRAQIDDINFKPPSRRLSKEECLIVDFSLILGSISVTCDSEIISSLQILGYKTNSDQIVFEISKSQIHSAEIKDQIKSRGTKQLILRLDTQDVMVCKMRCLLKNGAHEFCLEFKKNEELDELERWIFPKMFGPTGRKSSVCMIGPTPVRRSHVASQVFNSNPVMCYKSEPVQPSSYPTSSFQSNTPILTSSDQDIPKKPRILFCQMEPENKTPNDENRIIKQQIYLHTNNIQPQGNSLASQETIRAIPLSPKLIKSHLSTYQVYNSTLLQKRNNELNDESNTISSLPTCEDETPSKTAENVEKQIEIEPVNDNNNNKYKDKLKKHGKEEIIESSQDENCLISYVGKDLSLEDAKETNSNEKEIENFEKKISQEIPSDSVNELNQISPKKSPANFNIKLARNIISEWDTETENSFRANQTYKAISNVSQCPVKNNQVNQVNKRRSYKLFRPSEDFIEKTDEEMKEDGNIEENNQKQVNNEIAVEAQNNERNSPQICNSNNEENEQNLFTSLVEVEQKKTKKKLNVNRIKKRNIKKKRPPKNDVYDINNYSSEKEFSEPKNSKKNSPWTLKLNRKRLSKRENNTRHRKNSEVLFDQLIGDNSNPTPTNTIKCMLPAPRLRPRAAKKQQAEMSMSDEEDPLEIPDEEPQIALNSKKKSSRKMMPSDSDSECKFVSIKKKMNENKHGTKSKISKKNSEINGEDNKLIQNPKIHQNVTIRDSNFKNQNISNNSDETIVIDTTQEEVANRIDEDVDQEEGAKQNKRSITLLVSKNKNKPANEVLSNSLSCKKRKIESHSEIAQTTSHDLQMETINNSINNARRFYETPILRETFTKMYTKQNNNNINGFNGFYETPNVKLHQDNPQSHSSNKYTNSPRYFEAQISEPVENNSDFRYSEKFIPDPQRNKKDLEINQDFDDHQMSSNDDDLENSERSEIKKFNVKDSFDKHNKSLQQKKKQQQEQELSDSGSCSSGFTSRFSINKNKKSEELPDEIKLNESKIPERKKQKSFDFGAGGDATAGPGPDRSFLDTPSRRGDGDNNSRCETYLSTMKFIETRLKFIFQEHLNQMASITVRNFKNNQNIRLRLENINKIQEENLRLVNEMDYEMVKFKKKFKNMFGVNQHKFKENLNRTIEDMYEIFQYFKEFEGSEISKLEANFKKQLYAIIAIAGKRHENHLAAMMNSFFVDYFGENY